MTFANAEGQATLNNVLGIVVDRPIHANPCGAPRYWGTGHQLFTIYGESALFAYCLYKEFIR